MKDPHDIVAHLSLLEKAALLSGRNTWQTRAIERLGVPSVWMADGPHGVRKQVGSADHLGINASEPATCFPTSGAVANSWDEDLAAEIGAALGREAAAQGVHVLLGPGLNIKRSPLGGRGFEYFSEDPELAGRLAAAYVRGTQTQGVAATPKHFAVNSQELRRMVSDSVVDERTLREIYLTAFEIVVREARPWALMSAYNLINGTYAHEHPHLLLEILRDEWGFDGAVISDWGGSNDAVAAVSAGGTIEMPSPGFDSVRQIVAAVESGRLDENALDDRVVELLALVQRVTASVSSPAVDLDDHHRLARRAAAESVVLLRNQADILPLAPGTRVALIGDFADAPRYQGGGSSAVNPTRLVSLRDALADTDLIVTGFARGFSRDAGTDSVALAEATAAARDADVVILALGLPEAWESEGMDRSTLALPAAQIELLRAVSAANPRVVVTLSAGGAIETPWVGSTSALLHGFLGGQAGAEGLADVLTGAVTPSGRLAETYPLRLAHTPTSDSFPSVDRTAEYREGIHVGYRYYESAGVDVAFPFGFGLSYTTFAYSDLKVSQEGAEVTVTNTGSRPGAETVQMYVRRAKRGRVHRAALELKGFTKVPLAPGETRTISLPFTGRTFRHFDTDVDGWRIESGTYTVLVGSNIRDLPLSETIDVDGDVAAGTPDAALSVYASADVKHVSDSAFAKALGHPVPDSEWGSGPLTLNDPMDRLRDARSPLARWAFRRLDARRRRSERSGTPDLNILFLFNGPFRVLSKMSGGLATEALANAVLRTVNGQTVRGIGAIVVAFFRGRTQEKRTAEAFRAAATDATKKGM